MGFSACFVLGYACFGLAVRARLDDPERLADWKWWALGISICCFTSIAALRALRRNPALGRRTGTVRFWLGSGAIGCGGYGLAVAGITLLGMWEGSFELSEPGLLIAATGALVLGFGIYLAVLACSSRRAIAAWIDGGLDGPLL